MKPLTLAIRSELPRWRRQLTYCGGHMHARIRNEEARVEIRDRAMAALRDTPLFNHAEE